MMENIIKKKDQIKIVYCAQDLEGYSEDKYMNAFRKMLEQELKGCE